MNGPYPLVPLAEVLTHNTEYIKAPEPKLYPKLSVKLYGKGVVLDTPADGSTLKMKRHQIAKAGQIILSEIWGKKGAIGFVPPEGGGALCTSHFFLFDVRPDRVAQKYLQLIFAANYLQGQLDSEAKGTTGYAAVRPKYLLAAKIPLPPLDEQRRIVSRIEELTKKVQEARDIRQASEDKSNLVLSSALSALFRKLLSDGVPFCNFGSFTTFSRYGPRFYNEAYSEDGIRIMRATDIDENGCVDYDSMPKMAVSEREAVDLSLQPGDLVVVRSGSVGLAAVFNQEETRCIPAAYLIQFRFDGSVDPHYVRYCLQAPPIQEELKGRGTALKNINAERIKSLLVPRPDLEEQRRIVAHLNDLQVQVNSLNKLQSETAAELDALTPSILSRAFRGEL